jgi:hypothetical protein
MAKKRSNEECPISTILATPSSTMSRSNIAIWLLISLRSATTARLGK